MNKNDTYKLWDILYSSWGYNMTIVSFYKVCGKVGKSTLILREMAQKKMSDDGGWSGRTMPDFVNFAGEPFKARIGKYGAVKGKYKSEILMKWTGQPIYFNSLD